MHRAPPWFYPLSLHDALPISKSITCDVCAGLFSAADRCFPRARLQPPRETHSAGSSDTCCSRRSQRSSAPNNHHNIVLIEHYSTVAKHHVSEGNTRRLQRESEDDETPQRAFFASEEAHREPAESVVYFRSGFLRWHLCRKKYGYSFFTVKINNLLKNSRKVIKQRWFLYGRMLI